MASQHRARPDASTCDADAAATRCPGCGRLAQCTVVWPEARHFSGETLPRLATTAFCSAPCLRQTAMGLINNEGQRQAAQAALDRCFGDEAFVAARGSRL